MSQFQAVHRTGSTPQVASINVPGSLNCQAVYVYSANDPLTDTYRRLHVRLTTTSGVLLEGVSVPWVNSSGVLRDGVPCEAAESLPLLPGDVVLDVGVGAEVPDTGSINAETLALIGSQRLQVTRSATGDVSVDNCGSESSEAHEELGSLPDDDFLTGNPTTDEDSAVQAPGECDDDFFRINAPWDTAMPWYFNKGTTPGEITVNNAEASLIDGARAITDINTNCNRGDSVPAGFSYQDDTNLHANIRRTKTQDICKRGDEVSVVEFGQLDSEFVGYACWKIASSFIYEADIRLNKGDTNKWAINPGNCQGNKWIVRSVATHEFGHAFGLDDLDEDLHGNLTMSEDFNGFCKQPEYTLGLGDILGLEALY